jgi:mannan endo-1,4-beta-mannosidase
MKARRWAAVSLFIGLGLGLAGCVNPAGKFASSPARHADVTAAASPTPTITACSAAPQNGSRIGFYARSLQGLTAVDQLTTVRPAWALEYPGFGSPFPDALSCQYSEAGATPIIQLDPTGISVARIAAGDYDVYIRTYALAVKAYRAPLILSFGHEMNGDWYAWGWTHTAPATFVAAWQHIVTIFRQEGATNATWMWTVNIDRPDSPVAQSPAAWWPGDQYVGMVGIDGYFRYPGDTWYGVFYNTIAQVRAITGLPLLLSETAVVPNTGSYSQTQQLFQGVEENDMVGFVWFNADTDYDWQLQDDSQALAAFKAALPQYLGTPK